MRGAELFVHARCSSCHVPTLKAARLEDTTVGEQTFHPYTDLLLHDMGEDVADHRPAFAADGREWRTAPLWGIGLTSKVSGHTFFLHDGRARNLSEAILWHGGEASRARAAFVAMPRSERRALVAFLESL